MGLLPANQLQADGAAVFPLHTRIEGKTMKQLTLAQTADYLASATIEHSHDTGHAIVHVGRSALGVAFVLVNNAQGETVLTESM
jgi:hypothetical protein